MLDEVIIPAAFALAFTDGIRFWDPEVDLDLNERVPGGRTYRVDVVSGGEISFASGLVVIFDPADPEQSMTLARPVPAERGHATLSIFVAEDPPGTRSVETVRVRFADTGVVQWVAGLAGDGEPVGISFDGRRVAVGDHVVSGLVAGPGQTVGAAAGNLLLVERCYASDPLYTWWGLDRHGHPVELIIEAGLLLRSVVPEVLVPVELLLGKRGRVHTPHLDAVGAVIEVLDAAAYPGPWTRDESRWSGAAGPQFERPDNIAFTLRARFPENNSWLVMAPIGADRTPLWEVGGGSTTVDGWHLTFWRNTPALAAVRWLQVSGAIHKV